jgi:hypothetical protein
MPHTAKSKPDLQLLKLIKHQQLSKLFQVPPKINSHQQKVRFKKASSQRQPRLEFPEQVKNLLKL